MHRVRLWRAPCTRVDREVTKMRSIKTIAFITALVPAVAVARPATDEEQYPQQQQQPQYDDEEDQPTQGDRNDQSPSADVRLGVMVITMTVDLRTYFGAPRDSGLLVA